MLPAHKDNGCSRKHLLPSKGFHALLEDGFLRFFRRFAASTGSLKKKGAILFPVIVFAIKLFSIMYYNSVQDATVLFKKINQNQPLTADEALSQISPKKPPTALMLRTNQLAFSTSSEATTSTWTVLLPALLMNP